MSDETFDCTSFFLGIVITVALLGFLISDRLDASVQTVFHVNPTRSCNNISRALLPEWASNLEYNNADEVIPGLFIGNDYAWEDEHFRKEHKINIAISLNNDFGFRTTPEHQQIPLFGGGEHRGRDLAPVFKMAGIIIKEHLDKGDRVLVYAGLGVSRAPAVAIACLRRIGGFGYYDHALAHVRRKRPVAKPHPYFQAVLDSLL